MSEVKTVYGDHFAQKRPERRYDTEDWAMWEDGRACKIFLRFESCPKAHVLRRLEDIGFAWSADAGLYERHRTVFGLHMALQILTGQDGEQ